jgi:hypothetical protein
MTQITIDATLSTQLQQLGQVAELRDPSGRVVGKFVPLVDWSRWEPAAPEPTEAELDEIETANEWRSPAEVMARLKSLENR